MYKIESFEIHKLTLPLGRTVGDNNCSYHVINVVAIALRTNQGNQGWGYSESAWQGRFKHDAWYVRPLPDVDQLESLIVPFKRELYREVVSQFHSLI